MAETTVVPPAVTMTSMKRTEADKRKDAGDQAPISSIAPDYPYGLTIHMDQDELSKVGLKEMPAVGSVWHMHALVKVTATRQSASESKDEEDRSVDFQITDVGMTEG